MTWWKPLEWLKSQSGEMDAFMIAIFLFTRQDPEKITDSKRGIEVFHTFFSNQELSQQLQ